MPVTARIAYSPTEVGGIGKSLDKLFESFGTESTFARASNSNLLVLVSSPDELDDLDELIDLFSVCHPSRFFVLVNNPAVKGVQSEVTALCRPISKKEHLCTEVIRLNFSEKFWTAIPSIIQANLLTGSATELFLFDGKIGPQAFSAIAPLADVIIYDSENFGDNFFGDGLVQRLLARPAQLVDLQWIALGTWRDQVKAVFEKRSMRTLLTNLTGLAVKGFSDGRRLPIAARLMAGWLLERLDLRVEKASASGAVLRAASGKVLEISFGTDKVSEGRGLSEVTLSFDSSSAGKLDTVLLKRGGEGIETYVHAATGYRSAARFEEENRLDLIKRYYLIGESTANYRAALEAAAAFSV